MRALTAAFCGCVDGGGTAVGGPHALRVEANFQESVVTFWGEGAFAFFWGFALTWT